MDYMGSEATEPTWVEPPFLSVGCVFFFTLSLSCKFICIVCYMLYVHVFRSMHCTYVLIHKSMHINKPYHLEWLKSHPSMKIFGVVYLSGLPY